MVSFSCCCQSFPSNAGNSSLLRVYSIYNPTSFTGGLDAKNSSISFGGGYSQGSGWNANVTFTKKW
jgi:hypothetical protein